LTERLRLEFGAAIRSDERGHYLANFGRSPFIDPKTDFGEHPGNQVDPGGYDVHTHPAGPYAGDRRWYSPFSSGDIRFYQAQKIVGYVSTPGMRLFKYEPGKTPEEIQ
jgi:hypothetical protein